MALSALIAVLLVAQTWAHVHHLPDTQHATPPLSMVDRMDFLERLVLDQQSQLSHQDRKLNQQGAKLNQHEAKLNQKEAELNLQRARLTQQVARLNQQETMLRLQGEKLSSQEKELRQQESILSDTKAELSRTTAELLDIKTGLYQTKSELSQSPAELPHVKSTLSQHEQNTTVSNQERLQSQQRIPTSHQQSRLLLDQRKAIRQLNSQHFHSQSGLRLPREEWLSTISMNTTLKGQILTLSDNTDKASLLDVKSRSDDGGPLEVVVNHISQQVTDMAADIQAFKTQTRADVQILKNVNSQQDQDIQDAQSSTFVHWGSSQCGSLSQLVYSGVVGGSHYTHSGAATNYMCLTLSPVFSSHSVPGGHASLYGGEYQTEDSHNQQDPVCAVCRSTLSTTVMIPGTNICAPGWRLHYSGFLMAGNNGHTAGSEYICVDSKLQASMHSDANEDGKLLYYTVTHCGSLPCHPYINNKVVTCAVCGK